MLKNFTFSHCNDRIHQKMIHLRTQQKFFQNERRPLELSIDLLSQRYVLCHQLTNQFFLQEQFHIVTHENALQALHLFKFHKDNLMVRCLEKVSLQPLKRDVRLWQF